MQTISAVIITQNEEANIGRCLDSLKGVADEIVVVDSGSTDKTEAICRAHDAIFIHHDWDGYASQKNYADSVATKDIILSIDADEVLSDKLKESLAAIKKSEAATECVYSVNRLNNYCGRWVRHCGWYPDSHVRVWRRGFAHWDGLIHESLVYTNQPRQQHLDGDLLHYSYRTVGEHLSRMSRYAPLSARKSFDEGKRCGPWAAAVKPLWTFFSMFILKGGFLDGHTGYVVCKLSATYTLVKYYTLYQLSRENTH